MAERLNGADSAGGGLDLCSGRGLVTIEAGAGGGDRWAVLYRGYRQVVYERCRRLLPTAAAADDATQEIFEKLITRVPEVPAGEATTRWLHRVATNHCLNELRSQKRRASAGAACDASFTWQEPVLDRDLVRKLLVQIPERLSEVAGLRYVCGLELHEIASRVCVSRRTVVTRLRDFNQRARRLLPVWADSNGW